MGKHEKIKIREHCLRLTLQGGTLPFDPVLMFKVLVLQKFHEAFGRAQRIALSERGAMKFVGLPLSGAVRHPQSIAALWIIGLRIDALPASG